MGYAVKIETAKRFFTIGAVVFSAIASGDNVSTAVGNENARRAPSSISVASAAGAALNSNLLNGGGDDDTAILQKILDQAAGGKAVHLIIDGPALVRGLSVYGNTSIECTAGGGFYLKDQSAEAIIRNAHRSRESIVDEHIRIRGCFFNGNRNGQKTAGPGNPFQRAQAPDGTFRSALQFFGVNYLSVEDVILWNTRSFAAWVANAKFINIRNVVVDTRIPPFPSQGSLAEQRHWRKEHAMNNDDGLHFSGPIQYLTVDGVKLRTWDDSISLAANEWGFNTDDVTLNNEMGPYVGQGAITDVTISNVILMDSHHGFRLLSSNQRIDRVSVQNVTGSIRERMAVLSHMASPSLGNFGSVMFTNVNVDSAPHPSWRELYPERFNRKADASEVQKWYLSDDGEEGDIPLFSLNAVIESLDLRNVHITAIDSRPLVRVGRDAAIQSLRVDLSIHDPQLLARPLTLLGRVERLKLDVDWKGTAPVKYEGGKIEHLEPIGECASTVLQ